MKKSSIDLGTTPTGKPLPVLDRIHHIINSYKRNGVIDTPNGTILMDQKPTIFYHPKTGEIAGYEVRIRAFRNSGDLGVDPHRVFINPPDGREQLDDGTVNVLVDPQDMIDHMLIQTVILP